MAESGPIEAEIRKAHPEGGPLVEIAAKLAQTIDIGDGSVSMVRELRSILDELGTEKRWGDGRLIG
jgi:hypothetical protein